MAGAAGMLSGRIDARRAAHETRRAHASRRREFYLYMRSAGFYEIERAVPVA
jgi:hypothetical protein